MSQIIVNASSRSIGVPTHLLSNIDYTVLPKYKELGEMVAFPFNDLTCLFFEEQGLQVDRWPIDTFFDWHRPPDWHVMDHQAHMARHMAVRPRAFCFGDIGVGKTASAIWAMGWVREQDPDTRTLIISPKSTVEAVWERELFTLMPWLNVGVIKGTPAKKQAMLADLGIDVFVANPDSLRTLEKHYLAKRFNLIIVDEQTAFKTWNAARTKVLRLLVKHPSVRLWMMSGEPMPQSPEDMFAPGKMICPDRFPRTLTAFRERTMREIKMGAFSKWVPRENSHDTIREMVGTYAVRYDRDDCLDLPDTTYDVIEVPPTPQQLKIMQQMKTDALALLGDDGMLVGTNTAVIMMRLLQVSMGAVKAKTLDGDETVIEVPCKAKLDALQDIVDASHGPVIVYSPYLAPLDVLEKWATQKKHTYHRVDGSMSSTKRNDAFDAVQDGSTKLLLANPSAMAHGITLTNANTIVWWGLPYSQETYGQANGRIVRKGQKRKTYITHLLSMPVEQSVYKSLQAKKALQGKLLDLF